MMMFVYLTTPNWMYVLSSNLSSNYEEADTRIFLHAKNMALRGHTKIAVRTVDTDVLVLAISAFYQLKEMV